MLPSLILLAALSPTFGDAFWSHWGDGRAELAAYELSMPRYGETRAGTAVCIFVTEDFSEELRVKADPGKHDPDLVYPVMKLNLVQDFQTGIYDYNLMTSVFVALREHDDRPAGMTSKISFSSQEWCGNVYQQALFHRDRIEFESHSYFDGEADRQESIAIGQPVLAEDALLIWARGLAWPLLEAGESTEVPMLLSSRTQRLRHRDAAIRTVRLERAANEEMLEVAGARHAARRATVHDSDGNELWSIAVEVAAPHRILEWRHHGGEHATLLGSQRLAYWKLQHEGDEKILRELGLDGRP